MTIYIDVLWMRTFFVELNVCIFVNLWMKRACPTTRILGMCAFAVSAEVLLFVVAGYSGIFAAGSLTFRILLLKALFRGESRGMFLRLFLWSVFATIAAGGILGVCQEHMPKPYWFAAGSVLCALAVMVSLILEERRLQHDQRLYRVRLLHAGHEVEAMGLHDTGNRLRDPYVHAPVHVLARSMMQKLGFRDGCGRLIPFLAVGAPEGLMEVWTIDAMEWQGGRAEHVVIGVAEDELFQGKDYQLILSADFRGFN